MEPASEAPPPQQGCNLVNLVGCLLVPAEGFLGARYGYRAYGWPGGFGGAALGAVAGVICTPLVVVLLVMLVSVDMFIKSLPGRLKKRG